jgi:hypothetical protein
MTPDHAEAPCPWIYDDGRGNRHGIPTPARLAIARQLVAQRRAKGIPAAIYHRDGRQLQPRPKKPRRR